MSFLGNILSATIKTVATPIAMIKDVASVAVGSEPDATKKLVDSVGDDIEDAMDDLTGE